MSRVENAITFGEARLLFTKASIGAEHLLPLVPHDAKLSEGSKLGPKDMGKTPGRWNPRARAWSGLSKVNGDGGPSHFAAPLPADFVAECEPWPTHNIGIRGAGFPGIDSDVGSPAAARVVDQVVGGVFGLDGYGVRHRGKSPRVLYAFRGDVGSRPGALAFTLPDDARGTKPHVVEVIGRGKHFVVAGIHPSGDSYGWDSEADLAELVRDRALIVLTEADLDRFFAKLAREVEKAGGAVQSRQDGHGAGGRGERHDWSRSEPAEPLDSIMGALWRYPNTPEHLPTHGDAVAFLSKVYAALGQEAEAPGVMADVEEWVLDRADDFPEPPTAEWFQARWASFAGGVEHGQHALRMHLADNGLRFAAKHDFPDDAEAAIAECERHIDKARAKRVRLLWKVASEFCFLEVNTATDDNAARVRLRAQAKHEKPALQWWEYETTLPDDGDLIGKLRAEFGAGKNPRDAKDAFWRFQRALKEAHPDAFYEGEIIDPRRGFGEMVAEDNGQGGVSHRINTRALPEAQKLGAKLPKGSADPKRNADVAVIIEFMAKLFGPVFDYERDTLAYMAQKEKRPGNMLLIRGDSGTGKSNYCDMLSLIFDGPRSQHVISGSLLADENASRFAWQKLEGARILQLRELPETWGKKSRAAFDSVIKQAVDASTGGDMVDIESKGANAKLVHNFARIIAATNFADAVEISAQDRRIFYVVNGITEQNRPPIEWWDDTLLPIIKNPKRLAAFWRYLLDWDWKDSGYKPNKAPPVTAGKAEAQMAGISNPYARHMHAAVFLLMRSGRKFTDGDEVWSLMRAAACNEAAISGSVRDERSHYRNRPPAGSMKEAFEYLQRHFPARWAEFRDKDRKRVPTIYGAAGEASERLQGAIKNEVLDTLERDRARHRLSPDDWPAIFYGPITPPAPGSGDFDGG